jgi:hypothetical protein
MKFDFTPHKALVPPRAQRQLSVLATVKSIQEHVISFRMFSHWNSPHTSPCKLMGQKQTVKTQGTKKNVTGQKYVTDTSRNLLQ